MRKSDLIASIIGAVLSLGTVAGVAYFAHHLWKAPGQAPVTAPAYPLPASENGIFRIGIRYVDHPGQEAVYSFERDGCLAYVVRPNRSELDPYYSGVAEDYPGFTSLGEQLLTCAQGEAPGLDRWPSTLDWAGEVYLNWDADPMFCGGQEGVLGCNWFGETVFIVADTLDPEDQAGYATVVGHEVFHSVCTRFHDNKAEGDACWELIQ